MGEEEGAGGGGELEEGDFGDGEEEGGFGGDFFGEGVFSRARFGGIGLLGRGFFCGFFGHVFLRFAEHKGRGVRVRDADVISLRK